MQRFEFHHPDLPFAKVKMHISDAYHPQATEGFAKNSAKLHYRSIVGKGKRFVDEKLREQGIDTLIVLSAHGSAPGGWWFEDHLDRMRPVQGWVNIFDDPHTALLVASCNVGRHDLQTRYGMVIYPDSWYSPLMRFTKLCGARIYTPDLGRVTIR